MDDGTGVSSARCQRTLPSAAPTPYTWLVSVATATVEPATSGCAYTAPSTAVDQRRPKSEAETCAGLRPGSAVSQA
ncbi:hypothetical protein [Streptomyces sp. CB01881]|uniref:hypothetical protein n=1 Tax=Streptomyces sp. CB01881 TaxID=2078691 RepID=UPI001F11A487|nr:hypothetical protein [Streptomyces sp. CB01881]